MRFLAIRCLWISHAGLLIPLLREQLAFHHVFNSRLIALRGHLVPKWSMGRVFFERDKRDLLLFGRLETKGKHYFLPPSTFETGTSHTVKQPLFMALFSSPFSFHLIHKLFFFFNWPEVFFFFPFGATLRAPPSERLLLLSVRPVPGHIHSIISFFKLG